MNKIIPQLDAEEHFGSCAFWNSFDDWFLQRDQVKVHRYNGSLRLVDITDAMKPGKACEEFCFNWHPHETPAGLYRLFERHHYDLRSLFNELRALPWEQRRHWKTGEPQAGWQEFRLAKIIALLPEFGMRGTPGESVELYRSELSSIRVWSPFATVKPLPEPPKKWTVAHVVRALLSGQFSHLQCHGVYSDDYAYDNAVNFHRGDFSDHAIAFARRILESPSGWWASERGEAAGHVSICCHSFDSNSFKFELMKRFNPAAQLAVTPLPDGDIAIHAACAAPTRTVEADEVPADGHRKRKAKVGRVTPCAPSVTVVTLTVNEERDLVELRFPGKPSDDVRAEMKAAKFRWYGPAGCWYHKHTPENLAWAKEFVARHAPPVAATPPEPTKIETTVPQAEPASQISAPVVPPLPAPGSVIVYPQYAPVAPAIPSWRQRFAR